MLLFQVKFEWPKTPLTPADTAKLNRILARKPPEFIAAIEERLESICKVHKKEAEPSTLTQDESKILKWIEGKKIQLTGLRLEHYHKELGQKRDSGVAQISIRIASTDTADGLILPARYDEKKKEIIFVKPSEKPGKPAPGF